MNATTRYSVSGFCWLRCVAGLKLNPVGVGARLVILLQTLSLGANAAVYQPASGPQVLIPGGEFMMGSETGRADEQPIRKVAVRPFWLATSPVSVAQFAAFVRITDYVTTAEDYGNSGVFDMDKGRWQMITGASWSYPRGPNRSPAPADHPVTQVSWFDAVAYCEADSGRLPTEAEFEYAAKGAGQYGNPVYSFGETVKRDGEFLVNIFNGEFPLNNTAADGYLYTAPIGKTGITPLGLTDMAGNVWEWSADWYGPYRAQPGAPVAPVGSAAPEKSQRGGSFLCDEDVCHGYRTTGRTHSTPDTSLMHVGFRCAYDQQEVVGR